MPASEAQIQANRQNSARSTGPKTPEGKENSRRNSLKHGLTGEGVVLIEKDAAEVERISRAMESELNPSGTMGYVLIRRFATLAVRLDRSAVQETAALTERVRQAEADFVSPEGVDEAEAAKLRLEACHRAMFDPSKEATLARKYEAAAERGLYRALKEFRQVEKEAKLAIPSPQIDATRQPSGSFLPAQKTACQPSGSFLPAQKTACQPLGSFLPAQKTAPVIRQEPVGATSQPTSTYWKPGEPLWDPAFGTDCDVPFAIGKPR
jgi:hypothetical protein